MSNNLETSWDQSLDQPLHLGNEGFHQKYISYAKKAYADNIAPYSGITLLVLAQFFNSIMIVTCKLLVNDKEFTTPIHPLQILFVRMFITYSCCLAYMLITKLVPDAPWGPKEIRKLLVIRGLLGFFGVFGLYFSLQYLSLSDAVAILFLVPMITGFLAWVLLHERYSLVEAGCAFISLFGVVLIAKPNFIFGTIADNEEGNEDIESSSTEKRLLATSVGLFGAFAASSVYIILRKIGHRAHPLLSVSYFALWCTILTTVSILVVPGLSFVLPKNSHQWMLFALIGFSGFFMQFCLTAGIQRVKAAKASLMSYTNMIFALWWDLFIWGHLPGLLSFLGIILIISMAVIILRYKPAEVLGDLEEGETPVRLDESGTKEPELIALEDFIISDDEAAPEAVPSTESKYAK